MEPERLTLFYRFGAALVLGLFMGLQREYAYRDRVDGEGELVAGARAGQSPTLTEGGCACVFPLAPLLTLWLYCSSYDPGATQLAPLLKRNMITFLLLKKNHSLYG